MCLRATFEAADDLRETWHEVCATGDKLNVVLWFLAISYNNMADTRSSVVAAT
jgi:hypothetical protein